MKAASAVHRPGPLTDHQKSEIVRLATTGLDDREIATLVQDTETRVSHYRLSQRIMRNPATGNRLVFKGRNQPAHVRGEWGEREWFKSCEEVASREFERCYREGKW